LNRTPNAFDTEEQATEWLVRLDADSSETTLASWAQWLREDTRHHAAYVRVEEGWRQAECFKSLRPLDGSVRVDLLDEVVGAPPAGSAAPSSLPGTAYRSQLWRSLRQPRSSRRFDPSRPWRALKLSRLPAPYSALAVALGAGALASLLVLAGWHLLMTSP
jgi:ferric-dicitrate binding protein FerR (iron transport regulator)